MRYSTLVSVYNDLDSTTKRLEKTSIIASLLKKTSPDDMEDVVLLLEGRVFPVWDAREIGIAKLLMARAISRAAGVDSSHVEKNWKKTGDLGEVAEHLIGKEKQSTLASTTLTVRKVITNLRKITSMEGQGSVDRKLQLVSELLSSASPLEARYITRTTLQQLRIGTGSGTIRDAIAEAFFDDKQEAVPLIQEAYDLSNDFSVVAKAAQKGKKALEKIELHVGTPIKVMLAIKEETTEDALNRTGKPAEAEYKFDGFRVQIHKENNNVIIFTRRLEVVTKQFPEIVEHVKQYVNARSCILDAEAVGFNPKTKKYMPFQDVSQRIKRKYDIEKLAKTLPVEVNVFDVLSYNGKNYVHEPFKKRRALLEKIVEKKKYKILPAKKLVSSDPAALEDFFKEAKKAGTEGLVIKNLEAPYKPGARVGYMIKYKHTLETLDLVIIRADWGEGKRSKWMSSFTVACKKGSEFLEVGKVATGLKEKDEEGLSFNQLTEMLKPLVIKDGKEVTVKPKIILEVAYEELQKSSLYTSGFAMRFPRVIRLREDKGLSDVSSVKDVERIYNTQRR